MGVVNYYSVDGEILGEEDFGSATSRGYATDILNSVAATITGGGAVENAYRYKPYGATLSKTGAAVDPAFTWVGSLGSRSAARQFSEQYVRARHYTSLSLRWTSLDLLWPHELPYAYVADSPVSDVDSSGYVADCRLYKGLCAKGYIYACNAYYACMNAGNSPEANCMRHCLQRELKKHIRRGRVTCKDWVDDHTFCGGSCGYSNYCTNPETLSLLCNNLFEPGSSVGSVTCAELLKLLCSWPTPHPSSGITPGWPPIGIYPRPHRCSPLPSTVPCLQRFA